MSPQVADDIYFKGQDLAGRQVSFAMTETPDGKLQAFNVGMM